MSGFATAGLTVLIAMALGFSFFVLLSVVAVVSLWREGREKRAGDWCDDEPVPYEPTDLAAERRERAQQFINWHRAQVRAEMRQRLIDELDYSPLSREAEAWLRRVKQR